MPASQVPTRQREINIAPLYQATNNPFRISSGHIIDAILHPDQTEQLHPPPDSRGLFDEVSLFVQHEPNGRSKAPASLLIVAHPDHDRVNAAAAWRCFHDELPRRDEERPVELLERFLERYGFPLIVGTREPQLLTVFETVTRPSWPPASARQSLYHVPDKASDRAAWFSVRSRGVDVTLAYAVNRDRYRADQKHYGSAF